MRNIMRIKAQNGGLQKPARGIGPAVLAKVSRGR